MTKTLKNPKLYYRLDNFYSNHRNFVKSRSYAQLRGDVLKKSEVSTDCDPVVSMEDLDATTSIGGTQLSDGTVANPCGLIAKYMFDDSFRLAEGTRTIPIDQTKIAHDVDRDSKFKAPKNQDEIAWTDVENEHLMVWYQMETFPSFIKLWGHIDETLKAGTTYTFYV